MDTLDAAGLLARTHGHPYLRSAVANAAEVVGYGSGSAVVWSGVTWHGRTGHGLGSAEALLDGRLLDLLPGGLVRITLPRDVPPPPGYAVREEWDLLISTRPAPAPAYPVVLLPPAAMPAVQELLDRALPDSSVRPGDGRCLGWYGVWDGPRLVACAGDRSAPYPGAAGPPVASLGGVAVHPAHRRRGLGAAVSAGLTNLLRGRHDLVTLSVTAGNDAALSLYLSLGYTRVAELTTAAPIMPPQIQP